MVSIFCSSVISARSPITDLGAAKAYCDTTAIRRIEGIWNMTTDECKVMIVRNDNEDDRYDMIVLQCNDARLCPGDLLGELEETANPDQFKLSMKTGLKIKITCLATLASDDMALHIEKPTHRLKISPYMFLSHFWRLFRLESDYPSRRIKNGLVREYPQGINNRSNKFRLRYL